MSDVERITRAVAMALELHDGQVRKGSGAPYVFHPFTVAGLVADAGGDENQIIAALLHDAVEDAGGPGTRARIAEEFGDDVAELVDGCTDTDEDPKPAWRPRKKAHLEEMRRAAPRVRLIVAADKLHNVRALARDLLADGPGVWKRFRGGREGSMWYYRSAVEALGDGWRHPLLDELAGAVAEVERRQRPAADTD